MTGPALRKPLCSLVALILTAGMITVSTEAATAAPAADRITVSGRVVDADGEAVPGITVELYRIRSAKAKEGLDPGDSALTTSRTDDSGAYTLNYETSKANAEYAALFIVTDSEARRGYYSRWAGDPSSWESLVLPTNGSAIMYWGMAAPKAAYFRANPGDSIALGQDRLSIGGRLSGKLTCPGAKTNAGHAWVQGISTAVRGVSRRLQIPSGGEVQTALFDPAGKPYATLNLPAGTYRVDYLLDDCPYGKDPIDGYSASAKVVLSPGVTTSYSIDKAPVAPVAKPKIIGKVKVGETISISPGRWPTGTDVWMGDVNGVIDPYRKSKLTKQMLGKTIEIIVRTERAGHFAGVYTLKAKVKKGTLTGVPTPTIKGKAKVGNKLTAKAGTWKGGKLVFQWQRNGKKIAGAKKSVYKLTSKDRGKRITVKVTYAKAGFDSVTKTAKATAKVKVR